MTPRAARRAARAIVAKVLQHDGAELLRLLEVFELGDRIQVFEKLRRITDALEPATWPEELEGVRRPLAPSPPPAAVDPPLDLGHADCGPCEEARRLPLPPLLPTGRRSPRLT